MIQVTESAVKQIKNLQAAENMSQDETYLRVNVVTGGCSGMSYKLDFSKDVSPEDKVIESQGVKIAVDKKSYLYLVGMSLDYQGGLNGQGFVFNNPNATRTCGCGSSFGV